MRLRQVGRAVLLWSSAILGVSCGGTEPPVATSIVVTPGSVNFATVNATQALTAKVLDQKGDSMSGQTITWSSNSPAIATVTASTGVATAKANGTATITAASGTVSHPVTVTVAQVATSFLKSTGDAQIGTVGTTLATPLTVHLQDAGGSPIPGATVTFSVASGGGALVGAGTTTNATGDATAGWTLGTVAGSAQSVNATSGALGATFTATATAGAVSAVTAQAGDNQTRVTGLPLVTAPSVKVTDSFGNVKVGQTVVFAVVSGGGSVTGATQSTNAQGIATVGSWTMGPSAGANSLSATAQGTALSFTFTATATTAGAPTTMAMVPATNNQTALLGYATNYRPAVAITDAGGQPVAGVSVTFAVASGGGSVAGSAVVTNAFGIAQSGAWMVGAGANSVTATAAPGGIAGNPATISAAGQASAFNITLQITGPPLTPAVQVAFDSALAFWQRAIIADVLDFPITAAAGQCGANSPVFSNQPNDDVTILVNFGTIDGPGNILGQAGACFARPPGSGAGIPTLGTMIFDTADMSTLANNGLLNTVIRHEMGHVLGFASNVWNQTVFGCLQNPASAGNAPDTYFSCAPAPAIFDSIGGTTYTGGSKVPIENCGAATLAVVPACGSGNFNSHWREPTFGLEMMTGFVSLGSNPASVLSIAAMGALGYVVNFGAAEPYTKVFTAPALARAPVVDLGDDNPRVPLYVADRSGRILKVYKP